jgi:hypothetical protein
MSSDDLLSKNVRYTSIIIIGTLKIPVLYKNPETKQFLKIFLIHFLIFNKIFSLRRPGFISFQIKGIFKSSSSED